MKSLFALVAVLGVATTSFAAGSSIEAIAKKIKDEDTRTVIKIVDNKEGNPCLPEGQSYIIEVQVKKAAYDQINQQVVYSWDTEKSVSIDKDGHKMEVCAE